VAESIIQKMNVIAAAEVSLEAGINLLSTTSGTFQTMVRSYIPQQPGQLYQLIFSITLQSFNDLERGVSPQGASGPSARTAQSPKDTHFLNLQSSLALQVFKINSNVKGILKFVDQLGTPRDTGPVRKGL